MLVGGLKRMFWKIYGKNLLVSVVNIWLILDIEYLFLNVIMIMIIKRRNRKMVINCCIVWIKLLYNDLGYFM